jgi:hypothetical protein
MPKFEDQGRAEDFLPKGPGFALKTFDFRFVLTKGPSIGSR